MSTRTITVNHVRSIRPIDDADVYHYHRVNRECSLKPGAVVTVHHDLADPLD